MDGACQVAERAPPDTLQGITRILRYGLPNISWKMDAASFI